MSIPQLELDIDNLKRVLRIQERGPSPNPLGSFLVVFNAKTNGTTITFILADGRAVSSLALKRSFTMDPGVAKVLQTWSTIGVANGTQFSYDDASPDIANNSNVFYWVDCISALSSADTVTIGPQSLAINIDNLAPDAIAQFDASHSAVSGGVVTISVAFKAPGNARFGSCLIEISGYLGVASFVLIAQSATSPFKFNLEQTGETVTLKAIAVSQNGIQSIAIAPTKVLTLGAAATAPAKIIGATATEIATGVQISFPAGAEASIAQYSIFRGQRGQGFGAASSIGTVIPTGAFSYTFLDTNGLTGIFEWYVFATNAIGNSAASDVILPVQVSLTSADQVPNAGQNATNFATVDSIDNGTNATIRVYGASGGVGTNWTRQTGFGTESEPFASLVGFAYGTDFWVALDTSNMYHVLTTGPSATGDGFKWSGKVHTVNAGGGGGVSGGGGGAGGAGGRLNLG